MNNYLTAVITGGIINSKNVNPGYWLSYVRKTLNVYGEEPCDWEIYRGDSYQLQLDPEDALKASLHLKAIIRQFSGLDVRMGIGIGDVTYQGEKVTLSNGSAFERSVECFESLNKKTLAIKSGDGELDKQINQMLELALLTINQWSPTESKAVVYMIENPGKTQKKIAQMLSKSESTISETLKRAGYDEVMNMEDRYRQLILE